MKKLILILAVMNLSGTKPGKKKEEYPVIIEFEGVKIKHHHSLNQNSMLNVNSRKAILEEHKFKQSALEKRLKLKREKWEQQRLSSLN